MLEVFPVPNIGGPFEAYGIGIPVLAGKQPESHFGRLKGRKLSSEEVAAVHKDDEETAMG